MTIGEGRTAFDRLPTVVNVIELLLRSTFEHPSFFFQCVHAAVKGSKHQAIEGQTINPTES